MPFKETLEKVEEATADSWSDFIRLRHHFGLVISHPVIAGKAARIMNQETKLSQEFCMRVCLVLANRSIHKLSMTDYEKKVVAAYILKQKTDFKEASLEEARNIINPKKEKEDGKGKVKQNPLHETGRKPKKRRKTRSDKGKRRAEAGPRAKEKAKDFAAGGVK